MSKNPLLAILSALVALVAVHPPTASASTVTSTTTTAGENTVIAYSVTATGNEVISDFHVWVEGGGGKVDGTPSGPTVQAGQPPAPTALPGWSSSKKSRAVNWKCSGSGTAITSANSPATFTITIPTSQFTDGILRWTTTNDGNDNRTNGVVDSGPGEREPSTHGPIASVTVAENDAPINATSVFTLDSNQPGTAYRVFAVSESTDTAPNPETDYAAFVQWANQHPVPAGWGLSFVDLTGTTNGTGDSSAPRVTVPNTPSLVGNAFWIVVVVDTVPDDDSVSYKIASDDREVVITQP